MMLYSKYKKPGTVKERRYKLEVAEAGHLPFAKLFKFLVIAGIAGAAVFALGAGYRYLYQSEKFNLEKVMVHGNKYISKNEILAIARIENNRNIFKVNIREVEKKLKASPQLKSVKVERVFPAAIEISVVEREPVAFLGEEKRFQFDREGVVFQSLKHVFFDKKMFLVTGAAVNANDLGKKSGDEALNAALRLITQLAGSKSPYLNEISKIDISVPEDLELTAENTGVRYKLGMGNWDEKLERLENILKKLKEERTNIAYIDLRFRDEAAVMFKNIKIHNIQP